MSAICPPSSLLLRRGDLAMFVGRTAMGRRSGAVWAVFHAADGGWTHLYRIEDRDPRSVHLIACRTGDLRATLAQEFRRSLALATGGERRIAA